LIFIYLRFSSREGEKVCVERGVKQKIRSIQGEKEEFQMGREEDKETEVYKQAKKENRGGTRGIDRESGGKERSLEEKEEEVRYELRKRGRRG
jgi:hypothetical protein